MTWKIIESLLSNPAMKAILVALLQNNAKEIVELAYAWVQEKNKEALKS